MNEAIPITEKDELIMRLVHYFVTKENYSPIMVNGVKNEIWLENLEAYYKIVRINSNYIHNYEQLEFDSHKIQNVNKQISKKTLTRKLKTLNILTDINDDIKEINTKDIDIFVVKNNKDLQKNNGLKSLFPNIIDETKEELHGLDFFVNISNDINKKTEKENKFYEKVFKPKKIIVTKILLYINVLIYFLSILLSITNIFDINTAFALNGTLVKSGEIYRLLTCGFLHADIIHLIFNMYSLNIIGTQLESFIGKKRFLIVYLTSLISGSLLSSILNTGWSLGASGAIFGIIGSLIYFGYHYRIYLGSVLKSQLIPLLVFNLAIGFIIPNIDVFAHVGGLVGGVLSTMALGIEKKSNKNDKINGIICLLIFLLFLIFLLMFK